MTGLDGLWVGKQHSVLDALQRWQPGEGRLSRRRSGGRGGEEAHAARQKKASEEKAGDGVGTRDVGRRGQWARRRAGVAIGIPARKFRQASAGIAQTRSRYRDDERRGRAGSDRKGVKTPGSEGCLFGQNV